MDLLQRDENQRPKYAIEYAQGSWKEEATKFEQKFARKLYDSETVRAAGQTALSRVSTLLVRFNKLKSAEKIVQDNYGDDEAAIEKRHKDKQEEFEKRKAEADKHQAAKPEDTEKEKKELLDAIEKEKKDELEAYNARKEKIAEAKKLAMDETLKTGIDQDTNGRIKSSLMLGGMAEGGRGYNLSDGGLLDTMKAGQYISEVSGEEGNLMDQMSLLDNAVNTQGVDLGDGTYGFNEIMGTVSQEDLKNMNMGGGPDLNLDMKELDKIRGEDRLGEVFTRNELFQKNLNDKDFEARETKEASERRKGKQDNFFKRKFLFGNNRRAVKGIDMPPRSFFGQLGTVYERAKRDGGIRPKDSEGNVIRSARERRDADRADAASFFKSIGIDMEGTIDDPLSGRRKYNDISISQMEFVKSKEEIKVNKNDTSKKLDEKIESKDLEAIVKLEDSGFIRTSSDGTVVTDGKKPDDAMKHLKNDSSAKNMMNAYRILGATEDELVKFRLALMAYMIPTGKKTVYEILNDGKESGVPLGNIDMSEPGLMYETLLKSTSQILGGDITIDKDDFDKKQKAKEKREKAQRKKAEKEQKKKDKEAAKKKKDVILDDDEEDGTELDDLDGEVFDVTGVDHTEEDAAALEQRGKKQKEEPKEEPVKHDLTLPMKIIRDKMKKEGTFQNYRDPKGKKSANEAAGKKQVLVPPQQPQQLQDQQQQQPEPLQANPADKEQDQVATQSLERFKTAFADISGQAADIFTEGGEEEWTKRLSSRLSENAGNDEKKAALKAIISDLKGKYEGDDEDGFWKFFMDSFGKTYLMLTVGASEDKKYEEHTRKCIAFLKDNASDLKTLILQLYKEVKEAGANG